MKRKEILLEKKLSFHYRMEFPSIYCYICSKTQELPERDLTSLKFFSDNIYSNELCCEIVVHDILLNGDSRIRADVSKINRTREDL